MSKLEVSLQILGAAWWLIEVRAMEWILLFLIVEDSRPDDEGLSGRVASCAADNTFDIPETSSLKALFQLTEQHSIELPDLMLQRKNIALEINYTLY